jgi:hypothetical protein
MFCRECGREREPGANFCTGCRFPFRESDLTSSAATHEPSANALANWPEGLSRLDGEEFSGELSDVKITRTFVVNLNRVEPQPPSTFDHLRMLLTNKRLIFLDESRRLFSPRVACRPISMEVEEYGPTSRLGRRIVHVNRRPGQVNHFDLCPFWVLKRSANEELYQEFKKNPEAYSKTPGAYWVVGHRDWTWVERLFSADKNTNFQFVLVRVKSAAAWGRAGREAPTNDPEGTAHLSLKDTDNAKLLKEHLDRIAPELGPPFTEEYIANLPVKPITGGMLIYYYVFWIGLAVVIMLGVLSVLGFPSWTRPPLLVGGCLIAIYLLRRWKQP